MLNHSAACAQCGAAFQSQRSDARFCSNRCSYQHRVGKPHKRSCQGCGRDISDRHYNAQFCGPCYSVRPKTVHDAARKAKRLWHTTCTGCGASFEPTQDRQYCSMRCMGTFNRRKQIGSFEKSCLACGGAFTAQDRRRRTCSTACHQWILKNPGTMRVLARECRTCAAAFIARNANQYCCSSDCNRSARRARRRALEAGAFVEDVSRVAIANRDRWICQLCGKRVNKRLKFPHPLSQSLDHITPIALGGEHSRVNAQLAHLVCNISKGARLRQPQQLALIG